MNIIIDSNFPPLYKLDNRGQLREWRITANGTNYTISYGVIGKQLQTKTVQVPEGTARKKAYENWRNMLEDEYTVNPNQLLGRPFAPMLPENYRGKKSRVEFPVLVHRYYPGIRCIAHGKQLLSENGEPMVNLNHLLKWTKQVDPVVYLDGTLHSSRLPVKEMEKALRDKNVPAKTGSIVYTVTDAFIEDLPEAPYDYRMRMIANIINPLRQEGCTCIEIAPSYTAEFQEVIEGYHTHFIAEGNPGTVIRNSRGIYRLDDHSTDVLVYSASFKRKERKTAVQLTIEALQEAAEEKIKEASIAPVSVEKPEVPAEKGKRRKKKDIEQPVDVIEKKVEETQTVTAAEPKKRTRKAGKGEKTEEVPVVQETVPMPVPESEVIAESSEKKSRKKRKVQVVEQVINIATPINTEDMKKPEIAVKTTPVITDSASESEKKAEEKKPKARKSRKISDASVQSDIQEKSAANRKPAEVIEMVPEPAEQTLEISEEAKPDKSKRSTKKGKKQEELSSPSVSAEPERIPEIITGSQRGKAQGAKQNPQSKPHSDKSAETSLKSGAKESVQDFSTQRNLTQGEAIIDSPSAPPAVMSGAMKPRSRKKKAESGKNEIMMLPLGFEFA